MAMSNYYDGELVKKLVSQAIKTSSRLIFHQPLTPTQIVQASMAAAPPLRSYATKTAPAYASVSTNLEDIIHDLKKNILAGMKPKYNRCKPTDIRSLIDLATTQSILAALDMFQ